MLAADLLNIHARRQVKQFPQLIPADPLVITETKQIQLIGWQIDAFNALKDKHFAAIQAFCGSGKSMLQVFLAVHDAVSSNFNQKQLIVVPQNHIAAGFKGNNGIHCLMPNGNDYVWQVNNDFSSVTKDRTKALRRWLLDDAYVTYRGHNGKFVNAAICTSACLANTWRRYLSDDEKLQAIRNLTLRIDESHHVNLMHHPEDVSDKTLAKSSTILGQIGSFVLANEKQTQSKIHLTSATMERGDNSPIFVGNVKKAFVFYYLDFIDYYQTLNLEGFSVVFDEYESNPIENTIKRIKSEPLEKHFVVLPARGSKWRTIDGKEYKDLITQLQAAGLRVIDWVTDTEQKGNKEIVKAEPKGHEGDSKIDVVVTCRLGREGTDWVPCSRIHNLDCEDSITSALQIIGRAFRKFPGKRDVKIHYCVRKFDVKKSELTKRELLSNRTNAILLSMTINEMITPIELQCIPGQSIPTNRFNLQGYLGDRNNAITKDLIQGYEGLKVKSNEEIQLLIQEICEKHKIEEAMRDNVEAGLLARLQRQHDHLHKPKRIKDYDDPVLNVDFIRLDGFDIVQHWESLYFADCTDKDLKDLRFLFKRHRAKLKKFSKIIPVKKLNLTQKTKSVKPMATTEDQKIKTLCIILDYCDRNDKRMPPEYGTQEERNFRLFISRHVYSEANSVRLQDAFRLHAYAVSRGYKNLFSLPKKLKAS